MRGGARSPVSFAAVSVEIATAPPGPAALRAPAARLRRLQLDPVEGRLLLAFAVVSCWVLAVDLYQVIAHGRVWTGTDGFFITDQMQYLAWIQSASHHVLVSNMFVLRGTPADYFQPAIVVSGALVALGTPPWLALLLWKPVAVLATVFGIRAYAHRSLPDTAGRRTALALGLFYGSFTVLYGTVGVIGDMFPGFLTWGYPFGLIALGAMLYALVRHDRARTERRIDYVPAMLGALSSLMHPWQGETLVLILIGSELLWLRRDGLDRARVRLTAVTIAATALPLLYYLVLGRADPSWRLARDASRHAFPLWSIVLVLVPILPFALLGCRGRSQSFWQTSVRVFPLACLVIYVFSASGASATPLHAVQGITVPLGVLAVQGLAGTRWPRLRHRRVLGTIGLALVTIPATLYELHLAPQYMGPQKSNANFIQRDERAALEYLRHAPRPGGVLSRAYLGLAVPARTGRQTFVGDCLWSNPNCPRRAQLTNQLFNGQLRPWVARRFVRQTGAAYVLADCETRPRVDAELKPLASDIRHFGCAGVYELAAPTAPMGALASLPPDAAAVRTTWR